MTLKCILVMDVFVIVSLVYGFWILKFVVMKVRLNITVEAPDFSNPGSFKELYRNVLVGDSFIEFEFSKILYALRILYPGDDRIITFRIV